MKNFRLLQTGLDTVPAALQLSTSHALWNQNDLRTTHPESPHQSSDDIWIRFNDYDEGAEVVDDCECVNYPAFWKLTEVRKLMFMLMGRVGGERLGRCVITKLAPGETIEPHEDMGAPASYYERFHIVLQGLPGSMFKCGGEQVQMLTGDVWWFDNTETHEVINNSADDRIHIIIDIRTSK